MKLRRNIVESRRTARFAVHARIAVVLAAILVASALLIAPAAAEEPAPAPGDTATTSDDAPAATPEAPPAVATQVKVRDVLLDLENNLVHVKIQGMDTPNPFTTYQLTGRWVNTEGQKVASTRPGTLETHRGAVGTVKLYVPDTSFAESPGVYNFEIQFQVLSNFTGEAQDVNPDAVEGHTWSFDFAPADDAAPADSGQ
ncbi:MAG: hypothetical protein H6684_02975 [Deltaproteobacteria bacterium]|nr:hypothetical protein [bacterium]MCB9477563.1 hypothetical protein [Deltaproteobacteria bacterium]MCB9487677.1 hypothetical protein [Deltaproteobacteria bacterium]